MNGGGSNSFELHKRLSTTKASSCFKKKKLKRRRRIHILMYTVPDE